VSILLRGSNQLILDEAARSLHDALCVTRSLVKKPFLLPGGGAPEAELSVRLMEEARSVQGVAALCFKAYAQSMEVIPHILAENVGLNPIVIVTELRNRHIQNERYTGINVRKNCISDISEESVV